MQRTVTRFMLAAVAAGSLATVTPKPAQASCTEQYYVCLNDALQVKDVFSRQLEEIECGAAYAGCLSRLIKRE